jgi:transcriptional regulator with XRE-family HTH domain
MSQEALATAIGFRQTDVSKVERGVRGIDVLELRAWVSALGISFAEFASELDQRLSSAEVLQRQTSPRRRGPQR